MANEKAPAALEEGEMMGNIVGENPNDSAGEEILRMSNTIKVYPNGFVVNRNVDFQLKKGEIHALAGENGTGKSTLMKVLFGEERLDEGEIIYKGKSVQIDSPLTAIDMGIGMVHQYFMPVPSLAVAENMVLGLEPQKLGFIRFDKAVGRTMEAAEKYGLPTDAHACVMDLSVGLKQRVEILKVLLRGANILMLDEPTAVLTPQETVEIFEELKYLRKLGHMVIFISYKLNEIKEICDRITIMKDSRTMVVKDVASVSGQEISELMIGQDIDLETNKKPAKPEAVKLVVEHVNYHDMAGKDILKGISLPVRQGEILGTAGIEGNGQNKLGELITGMSRLQRGSIKIGGVNIEKKSIWKVRELKVSRMSQDRMTHGVVSMAGVKDNTIADRYYKREFNKGILLNRRKVKSEIDRLIQDYGAKCDDKDQPVSMLSGGNMQKAVVVREFSSGPELVIANQPTRGIDVGAAELVRNKLVELRDGGTATLLVSADLVEVMELSGSTIMLHSDSVAAYLSDAIGLNPEELGEYMPGIKTMDEKQMGRCVHKQ